MIVFFLALIVAMLLACRAVVVAFQRVTYNRPYTGE